MHILSNSLCAPDFQEILSIYLIVVKANPALNLFNYSTSFTNSRNFKQHPMKQQHLIFNLASYIYFFIKLHINLPFSLIKFYYMQIWWQYTVLCVQQSLIDHLVNLKIETYLLKISIKKEKNYQKQTSTVNKGKTMQMCKYKQIENGGPLKCQALNGHFFFILIDLLLCYIYNEH